MRNLECVRCGAAFGEETELATLRRERDEARALYAASQDALRGAIKDAADAADHERSRILEMLKRCEDQAMDDGSLHHVAPGADPVLWTNGFAAAATAFSEAAKKITRLDHHRDRGEK